MLSRIARRSGPRGDEFIHWWLYGDQSGIWQRSVCSLILWRANVQCIFIIVSGVSSNAWLDHSQRHKLFVSVAFVRCSVDFRRYLRFFLFYQTRFIWTIRNERFVVLLALLFMRFFTGFCYHSLFRYLVHGSYLCALDLFQNPCC